MGRARPTSVRAAFGASAIERQSLILAFLGIVISLITYLVAKDQVIPLWVAALSTVFFLAITFILISAFSDILNDKNIELPSVRAVIKSSPDDENPILLLDPSALFGIFSRVSIYHKNSENEYELLIAYGSVLTIQGDGKVQIRIEEWICNNDILVSGIMNQTTGVLANIVVKPSAPSFPRERQGIDEVAIDRIFAMAIAIKSRELPDEIEP